MSKSMLSKVLVVLLLGVVVFSIDCLYVGAQEPLDGKNIIFKDNFEDGLGSEWGKFGPWSLPPIKDGKLVISDKQQAAIAGFSNQDWTDYTFEVDFSVNGTINAVTPGASFYPQPHILIRAYDPREDDNDPENTWGKYYLLAFWESSIYVYKRIREATPTYTGAHAHFDAGHVIGEIPVRVKVQVAGYNIRVSIDGHQYIDYTDPDGSHPYGGAGVQSWQAPPAGTTWVFDNFVVYEN
jgi:hypothetical protein